MKSRRRSKWDEHDAEEHGDDELWIISYADMMTLLFGFFVILYSFSTVDEHKLNSLSSQISEAFKATAKPKVSESDVGLNFEQREIRALQLMVAMLNLGESMPQAIASIEQAAIAKSFDKAAENVTAQKILAHSSDFQGGPDRDESDERVIDLILPSTTLFISGSSNLSPAALAKLQALAGDLRLITDIKDIEVIGHTDGHSPQLAALTNNFALSSTRAASVATALIRFGIGADKLSVRGMGQLKPLVPELDRRGRVLPENMAKNRRVHLLIRRKLHGQHSGG